MTSDALDSDAVSEQGEIDTQAILDELASARREFRGLVESMSDDDLRRRSDGTRWTNEDLLFHMLFGYLIVRTLLWFCRALSRLPPAATKPAAALMNSAVRPFNWINYVGSRPRSEGLFPSPYVGHAGQGHFDVGTLASRYS